jgi:hypothetical protein
VIQDGKESQEGRSEQSQASPTSEAATPVFQEINEEEIKDTVAYQELKDAIYSVLKDHIGKKLTGPKIKPRLFYDQPYDAVMYDSLHKSMMKFVYDRGLTWQDFYASADLMEEWLRELELQANKFTQLERYDGFGNVIKANRPVTVVGWTTINRPNEPQYMELPKEKYDCPDCVVHSDKRNCKECVRAHRQTAVFYPVHTVYPTMNFDADTNACEGCPNAPKNGEMKACCCALPYMRRPMY